MNEKHGTVKKISIFLLVVVILISAGTFYIWNRYLGDFDIKKITESEENLKIRPEAADKNNEIINIAF